MYTYMAKGQIQAEDTPTHTLTNTHVNTSIAHMNIHNTKHASKNSHGDTHNPWQMNNVFTHIHTQQTNVQSPSL